MFSDKALQFDHSFALDLDQDAHIIVVATGIKKTPVTKSTGKSKPVPMAITNPFFIDVDGNGYQASKDTLGQPLPVSRKRSGD